VHVLKWLPIMKVIIVLIYRNWTKSSIICEQKYFLLVALAIVDSRQTLDVNHVVFLSKMMFCTTGTLCAVQIVKVLNMLF